MHHYQHHIGDYRRDTFHLSLIEHGAYRQLMDWYYLDEEPIPKETEVVFRRLSVRTEAEQNAVIVVLNEFFKCTENGYVHTRCDAEIEIYQGRADRARDNGKLGGRPKKTEVVNSGLSEKTYKEPKRKLTNNQEPLTNNQIDQKLLSEKKHSDDFTQFWKAYPKKTGKGAALKAWNKAKPPIDSVLKALAWQRTSKQWLDGFIVNPATYINQTRWEDEPEAKLGGGSSQVIYQSQPVQRDITKIAENMKRIKAAL